MTSKITDVTATSKVGPRFQVRTPTEFGYSIVYFASMAEAEDFVARGSNW